MTYGLHNLSRPRGAKRRKRVGRGNASGHGTYSTRGQKGQRARTGGRRGIRRRAIKQLISHLPKLRGFRRHVPKAAAVDVSRLTAFDRGALVTPEQLFIRRLVRNEVNVKIIGSAKLDRPLTVKAHAFSAAARRGITEAGGRAVVIPPRPLRPPRRPHRQA